ncbi:MAG: hypothetical protein GX270_15350 [Clostridiaceae bacterium]|jgi:cell fate (sporulation/competence/biofilm development) regulator YmcA (YheA/YmcA/DUF963 family)|nr:hypothetical protein [Clostridiaceae bacterium]
MEDKTFELLERMYSEFTEFRKETNKRFDNLESEVKDLKKDVLGMEHSYGKKLESLFDGYKQHERKIDEIQKDIGNVG